jgi:hypothetical protein
LSRSENQWFAYQSKQCRDLWVLLHVYATDSAQKGEDTFCVEIPGSFQICLKRADQGKSKDKKVSIVFENDTNFLSFKEITELEDHFWQAIYLRRRKPGMWKDGEDTKWSVQVFRDRLLDRSGSSGPTRRKT